ncbi:hypothetical protein OG552_22865 [Streptomyces sp. NBC_01476]|uniref:hypothetical protein n=1 Tax=Streptomyces sp. NBC_01476 TaxID=2903881 RepID=UPI002E322DDE|nr:hypothetical protein [Streptomyces sp. NBC_01476]
MNRRLHGVLVGALALFLGTGAVVTATGTASAQTATHQQAGPKVTLTARSSSITDGSPFSQVSVDTACPAGYQDNLSVFVVLPDGRETSVAFGVTAGAPFSGRSVTARIPAVSDGTTFVNSIADAFDIAGAPVADGVYPVHVVCGNADQADHPERPTSTGFIRVTGDTFQVKNLPAPAVTDLTLTAAPANHARFGQAVTLTAKVSPRVAGSVQFTTDGTNPIGDPVPVTDGKATVQAPVEVAATVRTYVATFLPADPIADAQDVTVFRYAYTNAPAVQVTDAAGNTLGAKPQLVPGQHITVSAQGFLPGPGEKVLPFVSNALALFAPVTTDAQGSVTGYDLTVPRLIAGGAHQLTLTGLSSFVQVSFGFTTK